MVITFQKSAITALLLLGSVSSWANEATLQTCGSGALMVAKKQVGIARYAAQHCNKAWQGQTMQIEFTYSENIPEWAFKRAATHFLRRNLQDHRIFDPLTQLYRPVKAGDVYRLSYHHPNQTLQLFLNQQKLGQLQHPQAQQYFKIWLGPQPFSATLKQQLLPSL